MLAGMNIAGVSLGDERTMVGSTPWRTAPKILKTSPASQTMMNWSDKPSALLRRKFSMICGEKTTTQQAMEMDLVEAVRKGITKKSKTEAKEKADSGLTRRCQRWPQRPG